MTLLIEKKDLELLIEKKRELIGNNVAIDTMIAAVSFLLSVVTAEYKDLLSVSGIIFKAIFMCIGILYFIKTARDVVDMCMKKYDYKDLLMDIERLDMIQHDHSLVVISRVFADGEKKFMCYYDERWDCKLFINYKTREENNECCIVDSISADLDISKDKIVCRYITSRVQEKYSVSHAERRVYNHRLYEVSISEYPQNMDTDDFVAHGKHYYWMSMDNMECDDNIRKKNLEVLGFVKESLE